jgi:hypothetical protein
MKTKMKTLVYLTTACAAATISVAHAATITSVGVDATTGGDWRTSGTAKPLDVDGDNIYGTDGYMISSFEPVDTDPRNTLVVPYATYGVDGGVVGQEGPDQVAHQSMFDDVTQTGVGPVPDVSAGDWYVRGGGVADYQPFFTITLSEAASFRLGVITDQTPDNPTGLIGESSDAVRVDGPGGTTASLELAGKDAVPDYVLFDITGDAGDVFTILGRNDLRWQDNALGGFFIDTIPEPSVPLLGALGCLGLILRRRR